MVRKLLSKEVVKNDKAYPYTSEIRLGPWTTYSLLHDPIHLCFVASRYKFVARMLTVQSYFTFQVQRLQVQGLEKDGLML